MYNIILKYFYSWYTLPMVYLHEYCHAIMAIILGIKIKKIKIYKNKKQLIFNGYTSFKYYKNSWKWYLVTYAPLMLVIPIFLMFINTLFFYIGLYIITTVIYYEKNIIWMILPSKMDMNYKNIIEYYTYVVESTSEDNFNDHIDNNKLFELIIENNLLNEFEFKQEKINKKNKN